VVLVVAGAGGSAVGVDVSEVLVEGTVVVVDGGVPGMVTGFETAGRPVPTTLTPETAKVYVSPGVSPDYAAAFELAARDLRRVVGEREEPEPVVAKTAQRPWHLGVQLAQSLTASRRWIRQGALVSGMALLPLVIRGARGRKRRDPVTARKRSAQPSQDRCRYTE